MICFFAMILVADAEKLKLSTTWFIAFPVIALTIYMLYIIDGIFTYRISHLYIYIYLINTN